MTDAPEFGLLKQLVQLNEAGQTKKLHWIKLSDFELDLLEDEENDWKRFSKDVCRLLKTTKGKVEVVLESNFVGSGGLFDKMVALEVFGNKDADFRGDVEGYVAKNGSLKVYPYEGDEPMENEHRLFLKDGKPVAIYEFTEEDKIVYRVKS